MSRIPRFLIPATILFLVIAAGAGADYDLALESYLKEDYIKAAQRFDRLISESSSHPKLPMAVYYSALCRLKLDQPAPALDRLRLLLSDTPAAETDMVSPSQSAVRLALGSAHQMQGDDTAALSFYESSWLNASNSFERAAAREKIKELRSPAVVAVMPAARNARLENSSRHPAVSSKVRWVVQVASYPDRAQADAVRSQLQNAGWPAYMETADVRGDAFFRIRVGPYASESEAGGARGRIKAGFGLDGWVTR